MAPGGLMATTGEVSVSPYPSWTGLPVTSVQCFEVSAVNAIPPDDVTDNWLKSSFRKSGLRSSALNKVFKPTKQVNGVPFRVATKFLMSRGLGIKRLWLPSDSAEVQ